jgi:hypothetical protein
MKYKNPKIMQYRAENITKDVYLSRKTVGIVIISKSSILLKFKAKKLNFLR